MCHAIKIFFITSILFLTPVIGQASDAQLTQVDALCVGIDCAKTDSSTKPSPSHLVDFSFTPVQMLLAGIVLVAIRIAVKKYLLAKSN